MKNPKSKSTSLTARQHRFRSARAGALTTFLLLPMALPAGAATFTWDGEGADNNFNTAGNWVGDVAPTAAGGPDNFVFAGSTRLTPANNIAFALPASTGIRFDDAAGAFVIGGGSSFRLGTAAIDFDANPGTAITQTINTGITIATSSTVTVTTQSNGAITLGGIIVDGGAAGALTKTGEGTLTLNGANSFGGAVRIDEGIVNANTIANAGTASSLGDGAGTSPVTVIRIGNGTNTGTLVYTGAAAATTDRQIRVGNGNTGTSTGGANITNNNANAAHTLTFSNATFISAVGSATADRTLTLGGTNTGLNTIIGAIVDNSGPADISLTKADAGTWVLGGASTYDGDTTLSGGTLRYGIADALPIDTNVIFNTASGTTTLDLNGFSGTIASLTIEGAAGSGAAVTTGAGTLTLGGNVTYNLAVDGTPDGATITGKLDLGAVTRTFEIKDSAATDEELLVSAVISGSGGLTQTSTGQMTLSGPNTFTGDVVVREGVLSTNTLANLGEDSSIGAGTTGVVQLGYGSRTGILQYTGAATSTNRQIQLGRSTAAEVGGGVIENNGSGALTFSSTPFFNAPLAGVTATRNLTLRGTNTGLNTISGVIVDNDSGNGGVVTLTKEGTGTWLLAGANIYNGFTNVNEGTLLINGSTAASSVVTVAEEATLGGSGTVGTLSELNTLTVNGTLAPGNSTGILTTGILTVNKTLDLDGSLSVELKGTTAGSGHDRVVVNGAVDITGSSLTTSFSTFTPVDGNLLFILVNDGSDPVTGTFAGKAQDAIIASYAGFDWKISYTANSAGNSFTGGNDIALMAVPEPASVILSSWTFDSGADPNARLASSATASGLTVSQLTFHPTFDAVPTLVNNEDVTLNTLSTHDRWAADSGIGILRLGRANYTTAPIGRSATFNTTNTSISGAAGTFGAPIWFSVSTDALTNATIRKISITNPGGGDGPVTYYFSKVDDPLGTGVSVISQETISLTAPITLAASETVYFSINMDSGGINSNHNINRIDLEGTTEALPPPPPPFGLVTSTLTVAAPHGEFNQLDVEVNPTAIGPSSDTSNLTGTIDITVNIDPDTGKTALLTLSDGRVAGTDMNFSAGGFLLNYNIDAEDLSAEVKTLTPPGTVNPDTGIFAAAQHGFILDQGTFAGTAAGSPFSETLTPANPFSGSGTGNGTLTLTPAGISAPYLLFNAVLIMDVGINEILDEGKLEEVVITGEGTVKATGQIQIPASEFYAWMIAQGATNFEPNSDNAGNGAPDAIKWALGLDLYDDPLPFLLKANPDAPGTFTISLPPGGTLAPLTVQSSTTLLPDSWTLFDDVQMAPSANPIPAGSTGLIEITPTAAEDTLFLRMQANP